jgi:hypothetical protein
VEVEDGAARRLVIVCVWTFESTPECNSEYCIGSTLVRFITAMVLHSFCLSCVCKLILAHT